MKLENPSAKLFPSFNSNNNRFPRQNNCTTLSGPNRDTVSFTCLAKSWGYKPVVIARNVGLKRVYEVAHDLDTGFKIIRGSLPTTTHDIDFLHQLGTKTIVDIRDYLNETVRNRAHELGIEILCPSRETEDWEVRAAETIEEARHKGGVYVHCKEGIESTTAAVAIWEAKFRRRPLEDIILENAEITMDYYKPHKEGAIHFVVETLKCFHVINNSTAKRLLENLT